MNKTNEQLQQEVKSLQWALSMTENQAAIFWKEKAENLAAENAHLLAALRDLGDPRFSEMQVLMEFYSHSGAMAKSVMATGYRQAAIDMRADAESVQDPELYDEIQRLAHIMLIRAESNIIKASC